METKLFEITSEGKAKELNPEGKLSDIDESMFYKYHSESMSWGDFLTKQWQEAEKNRREYEIEPCECTCKKHNEFDKCYPESCYGVNTIISGEIINGKVRILKVVE